MLTSENQLRRVKFSPYLRGKGPTFNLVTWDCNRRDGYGKAVLGYRLTMTLGLSQTVLFEGEDMHCAPGDAVDSDAAIESIMSFLTLRPGDTDPEYFKDYTAVQLKFCSQWAETLSGEVQGRYCDENGNVKKG